MTFRLLDAAFTLSAAIDTTLDECKEYAGAYYDDIIVHSPDLETHFQQVDTVLDKLVEREGCVLITRGVSLLNNLWSLQGLLCRGPSSVRRQQK